MKRSFYAFRPVPPSLCGYAFRTVARLNWSSHMPHSVSKHNLFRPLCVVCVSYGIANKGHWSFLPGGYIRENKTTTETQTTPYPRRKQLRTHWVVASIRCILNIVPSGRNCFMAGRRERHRSGSMCSTIMVGVIFWDMWVEMDELIQVDLHPPFNLTL